MEGKPHHGREATEAERQNQTDKSLLDIGQEVSVLVKATAFRFSTAFWKKVPLKWHKNVKLVLKLCAVVLLTVMAFAIGWHASKAKYGPEGDSEDYSDYGDDLGDDVVIGGDSLSASAYIGLD